MTAEPMTDLKYFVLEGIGMIVDMILFAALAAIPLAALVYLDIISLGLAQGIVLFVAFLAAARVIIIQLIRVMNLG